MITRIEAYRYRCFERLGVDLSPFQILVGCNGAGKSTLVDIPILIGEMLQKQDIHQAFFRPSPSHERPRADGGMDLVFNRTGGWFALAIEAKLPPLIASKAQARFIRYELSLSVEDSGLELTQESVFLYHVRPSEKNLPDGLWLQNQLAYNSGVRTILTRERGGKTLLRREPRWPGPRPTPIRSESRAVAPSLAFVPSDDNRYPACNWLRQHLRDKALAYMPIVSRLRNAQPSPGKDFSIAYDGSTLPWSILQLQTDRPRLEEWIMHVQSALPLVSEISAHQREDDKFAYVKVQYTNGLIVPAQGLSDGTLSILAFSILPFLDNLPSTLVVEEPENGIHPKAIETILESLSVMQGTQVFVTSHSPIVVAVTNPDRLLCLRQTRQKGVEVIPGSQHPKLREWQGTPSLDTLFNAGVL
jgi:ABC-type Mn2+/Zn2+ transport system ATPase subunit